LSRLEVVEGKMVVMHFGTLKMNCMALELHMK
jgi:hypothetical protein